VGVADAEELTAEYLPDLDGELRATAERLIAVVLEALPDAEHARKWGRLTITREDDWHHWIGAVSATKDEVKLHLHKGALLSDPGGLMKGSGQYVRAIAFRAPEEIDADVLAGVLKEAAARQTDI
jgi:hypothetical protein